MASPRSMWSGTISLGLLSIPVTIAKAWSEDRETGLRDLCAIHKVPVERFERCHQDNATAENILAVLHSDQDDRQKFAHIESYAAKQCELAGGKIKGVEVEEGVWRTLSESEMANIESASASDVLLIEDYRPVYELPMEFGTGTYFVRYNPPKKGSTVNLDTFATFAKVLGDHDHAAIVMWKLTGSHRLSALHVASTGELLLTVLPTEAELRKPDSMERRHIDTPTDKQAEALFHQLLTATSQGDDFDHSRFKNEAKALRSAAVDKILAEHGKDGNEQEKGEQKQERKSEGEKVPDLMRQLQESMLDFKKTEQEKV